MAQSDAFLRNADTVVDLVNAIPRGRVTTYGAIGETIGIAPRYVALIMATAEDVHASPWWRVVSAGGVVRSPHRLQHRRLLEAEGILFKGDKIADFEQTRI